MKKIFKTLPPIIFALLLIEMGLRIESHFFSSTSKSSEKLDVLVVGDSIAAQVYRKIKSELEPKYRISSQTILAKGPQEIIGLAKRVIEKEKPSIVLTLTGVNFSLDLSHLNNGTEVLTHNFFEPRILPWFLSFFKQSNDELIHANFFDFVIDNNQAMTTESINKYADKLSQDYSLPIQFSYLWDFFDILNQKNVKALLARYQSINKEALNKLKDEIDKSLGENQDLRLLEMRSQIEAYHYRRIIDQVTNFALAPKTTPPNLYNMTIRHDRFSLFKRLGELDERESFINEFKEYDLEVLDNLHAILTATPRESCQEKSAVEITKSFEPKLTKSFMSYDLLHLLSLHCQTNLEPIRVISEYLITRNILSRLYGTSEIFSLLNHPKFKDSAFIQDLKEHGPPAHGPLNASHPLAEQDEVTKGEVIKIHRTLAQDTQINGGQYFILQYPGYSDKYLKESFSSDQEIAIYNLSDKLMGKVQEDNFYEFFKDKVDATTGHLTNKGLELATKDLILELRFRLEGLN